MKFLHTADLHIGAKPDSNYPWGEKREKEIIQSLHKIIDICNEQEVDLLLIAGDLFHRQPLIRELKEVNYCFSKLKKTRVVIIAGNHDYINNRSNYNGFEWEENVYMFSEPVMDSIYFEDINTEVYGLSYHQRFITEPLYDTVFPGCEERINILLAHGGSEKDIPFDKEKLINSGFDYIALGHIHQPQIFGERMAYSGSPEPLDKTEIGKRGYIIGKIEKNGETSAVSIVFTPCSAREYVKLEIPVQPDMTSGALTDLIKDKIRENGPQHIYLITLTGIRDADIRFEREDFVSLGNIIEFTDLTVPDYDFEALYRENQDNIIGLYIKRIKEIQASEEVKIKALYYGMEALLKAKDYK